MQVIKLKTAKNGGNLTLPGDVQAFTSAPIYAQVSGYVQKWYFDIGAPGEERPICWPSSTRAPMQAALAQAKGAAGPR